MPRPLTEEEMREIVMRHIWVMIRWWENESRVPDARGKLEGLAFSFLSMLDGCNGGVPCGFKLAPNPHPEDKQYRIDRSENWVPTSEECPDIDLSHELMNHYGRKFGFLP